MNNLIFSLAVGASGLFAGLLGSLTGLGGGVVLVPLLSIAFGIDIRYAIGASLISVIATSSGAAAAYVKEGYTNIRVGMFLEVATTIGALTGAFVAGLVSANVISIVFGLVLLYSAFSSIRTMQQDSEAVAPDPLATRLRMNGTYPTDQGRKSYNVRGGSWGGRVDVNCRGIIRLVGNRLRRPESDCDG